MGQGAPWEVKGHKGAPWCRHLHCQIWQPPAALPVNRIFLEDSEPEHRNASLELVVGRSYRNTRQIA
jgi:hypothetical protein